MLILYRACSTGNTDKHRPIVGTKIDLVRYCFQSFLYAFKDVDYELICLLDKPTVELREIFKDHQTEETFYSDFNEGNVKSFHRQLDLVLEHKDDFLLIEDDYFFLPHSGPILQRATSEIDGFLTPYDHIGYYTEDTHDYLSEVKLFGGHHWRSVLSTTLTFGGKYEALKEEYDVIKKYGWADHPMWCEITENHILYSPIPTLATHMETEYLAPCTDYPFIA